MENVLPKLQKLFLKKKLEIREKKTVIAVYYENLQLFSISNVRYNKELEDVTCTFTFNILKQNKKVLEEIEAVELGGTPFIKNITEEEIIYVLKEFDLIHESKKLTEFNEVQKDYELGVAEKDGKTLEYRKNLPTEIHIVQAVFKSNEYINKGLKLSKKDVVFDLGGNIGAFSCEIFDKVKKVITIEPETVNFGFLTRNLKRNKASNVETHQVAVVGNEDKVRQLFLGKVPYYYSFLVKNNRKPIDVHCINIQELIDKHEPTKMKIDIEGAELEVMLGVKDFKKVNQIIFEYNFDMNGDLKSDYENFKKLKKHLKKSGFDISDMNKDLKKNWNMVFLVNKK